MVTVVHRLHKQEFFSLALQPSAGYGLLVSRDFLITHSDAPQSVGLLWTSDQLVAETSDNTQHTKQTNIHACCENRIHDRSRRAAVNLGLRPRGHWDRLRKQNCFFQNFKASQWGNDRHKGKLNCMEKFL
jgi:hypothetical protein